MNSTGTTIPQPHEASATAGSIGEMHMISTYTGNAQIEEM
jgi:hypothetical protein